MDVEYLLGSVLRGVLTSRGKRKKTKGALRYVLGNPRAVGGGAMLLGGLALALYESLTTSSGLGTSPAAPPTASGPPGQQPVPSSSPHTAAAVPPPLPSASAAPLVPPPLPVVSVPAGPGSPAPAAVPAEVLRVIRLSISAARADGQLTTTEQDAILEQARQAGAAGVIEPDLRASRPVAEILAGVTNDFHRHQLYSIAFAIVRADEQVTPDERVYLQQVAAALTLTAETVARLEQQAAASIAGPGDAAPPS